MIISHTQHASFRTRAALVSDPTTSYAFLHLTTGGWETPGSFLKQKSPGVTAKV